MVNNGLQLGAGRAFNYEPPTADMIDALGVLTQYLTVVEDPRDREAPRKPAQVPHYAWSHLASGLHIRASARHDGPCRSVYHTTAFQAVGSSEVRLMLRQGSSGAWLPTSPVTTGLPGAGGRAFGAACAPAPARLGGAGSPAFQVLTKAFSPA